MSEKKQKTCPKCGQSFLCSHSATCWCVTVFLSEEAKTYLQTTYSDCLCENCLKQIVEKDFG
ncbi:MAG: cysteine-rich CWC family protein [Lentimicrobiaceae bacterium]|nr:cysteine-rich CWC family protein [Lentimicrobiaceae bacterium]